MSIFAEHFVRSAFARRACEDFQPPTAAAVPAPTVLAVASLPLPKRGERPARVELPPTAPDARTSDVLELYLVATDDRKNEVLVFGSPDRPRQVSLQYEPPKPWYGKWWVWAIAGTVVAAGAALAQAGGAPPPVLADSPRRFFWQDEKQGASSKRAGRRGERWVRGCRDAVR